MLLSMDYPKATRRLRLGFVGGGRGALVGAAHASGARLSNRWEVAAARSAPGMRPAPDCPIAGTL